MSTTGAGIGAIVTDIEGTAASISFVKEKLFPYSRARLSAFVEEHGTDAAVRAALAETRELAGRPELDAEGTVRLLLDWIDADKKAGPLKALQGMIWDEGFAHGDLVGDVYADAAHALRRWHAAGYRLYVYSSGSVQAQKLVFGHTAHGDLTALFSGYFDTRVGGKLEAGSYRVIAAAVGLEPKDILFLSDHVGELDAARQAGFATIALDRGEVTIPASNTHPVAKDFDEVEQIAGLG
jgi:enolase-phosphatase E1